MMAGWCFSIGRMCQRTSVLGRNIKMALVIQVKFWVHNDNVYHLLFGSELRADLTDFERNTAYAKYSILKIEPEERDDSLTVERYSGNNTNSPHGLP